MIGLEKTDTGGLARKILAEYLLRKKGQNSYLDFKSIG
jgi:hypothetical protein